MYHARGKPHVYHPRATHRCSRLGYHKFPGIITIPISPSDADLNGVHHARRGCINTNPTTIKIDNIKKTTSSFIAATNPWCSNNFPFPAQPVRHRNVLDLTARPVWYYNRPRNISDDPDSLAYPHDNTSTICACCARNPSFASITVPERASLTRRRSRPR